MRRRGGPQPWALVHTVSGAGRPAVLPLPGTESRPQWMWMVSPGLVLHSWRGWPLGQALWNNFTELQHFISPLEPAMSSGAPFPGLRLWP